MCSFNPHLNVQALCVTPVENLELKTKPCLSLQSQNEHFDAIIPKSLLRLSSSVSPSIFSMQDIRDNPTRVIEEWKARSYFLIRLPGVVMGKMVTAHEIIEEFFKLPPSDKSRCAIPCRDYLGYKDRPSFDKELFQVRYMIVFYLQKKNT